MIGVSVTFRYDGDFDRARVVRVADNARAMFEGMPGLRFKFFTFDEKQQRATNFYVWDSQEAAEQFFTERTAGASDQPLRGDALHRLRGDRTDRGQLGLVAQEVTPTICHPRRLGATPLATTYVGPIGRTWGSTRRHGVARGTDTCRLLA